MLRVSPARRGTKCAPGDGGGKDKITAAACIMIYLRALRCAAWRFTAAVTLANVVAPRYLVLQERNLSSTFPRGYEATDTYTHARARAHTYTQVAAVGAVRSRCELLAGGDTTSYRVGLRENGREPLPLNFA